MTTKFKDDTNDLFAKLSKDFKELVNNKQLLKSATEQFLNSLIDELTLGIIFDIHRKAKTGAFDLDADENGLEIQQGVDIDIYFQYTLKKTPVCVCPYCNRASAATRFAKHLETCMDKGKDRQKNAARKVAVNNANKEQETSYKDSGVSDNEDDDDWSPGNKRRMKKKERNGKKRSKGTPKKNVEMDYLEISLPEPLSRPGSSSGKKKEKPKSKKNRKDRTSPCSSTSSLD